MGRVLGLERTIKAFRKRGKDTQALWDYQVVVGYSAAYAVYVHENLAASHKVGQAKFLEQPARELGPELGGIIKDALWRGADPKQALMLAGLRLQAASQRLVPVDTGNLRASAYTMLTRSDGTMVEMVGGGEGGEG